MEFEVRIVYIYADVSIAHLLHVIADLVHNIEQNTFCLNKLDSYADVSKFLIYLMIWEDI